MARNILLITTDQMRYDALGCNGGKIANTKNIDQLREKRTLLSHLLVKNLQSRIRLNHERFDGVLKNLHALSPLAILDRGYSITNFQGKIYVDKIAQKTDGYQMSRSLLLDDISKSNNKPELEIYADDVKCSHGSTISKIDQDHLYYFNSRGISSDLATKILKKAF